MVFSKSICASHICSRSSAGSLPNCGNSAACKTMLDEKTYWRNRETAFVTWLEEELALAVGKSAIDIARCWSESCCKLVRGTERIGSW